MKQDLNIAMNAAHLIRRAAQRADAVVTNTRDGGLTARRATLLLALSRATPEGINQVELVRSTGIDRSTLSSMLVAMDATGLVKRKTNKVDRRATIVTLTAKGRREATKAAEDAEQANNILLQMIPAADRAAFIRSLEAVAAGSSEAQ